MVTSDLEAESFEFALGEVLRMVNPILRGWAAYFRYGVSKKTFAYLGYYA